jgi:hypothetical protein
VVVPAEVPVQVVCVSFLETQKGLAFRSSSIYILNTVSFVTIARNYLPGKIPGLESTYMVAHLQLIFV